MAPLDHTGQAPVTPARAAPLTGQKWTVSGERTTLTGRPSAAVPPSHGSVGRQGRALVHRPWSSTAAPASTNSAAAGWVAATSAYIALRRAPLEAGTSAAPGSGEPAK